MRKKLIVVGYQIKYASWEDWQFVSEHPGPIPECYADREIRPVYVDLNEPSEKQHWERPIVKYIPYE